jgi:hypothetical protein
LTSERAVDDRLDTPEMQQQDPAGGDCAQHRHRQTCRSLREDQLKQGHGVVDTFLEGAEGAIPAVCGHEDALTDQRPHACA